MKHVCKHLNLHMLLCGEHIKITDMNVSTMCVCRHDIKF